MCEGGTPKSLLDEKVLETIKHVQATFQPTGSQITASMLRPLVFETIGAVSLRALRVALEGCLGVDLRQWKFQLREMAMFALKTWTAGLEVPQLPTCKLAALHSPCMGEWELCSDVAGPRKMGGHLLFTALHDLEGNRHATAENNRVWSLWTGGWRMSTFPTATTPRIEVQST